MATDITPQLWQTIRSDFNQRVKSSSEIKAFTKKLDAGKATGGDVQDYAGMIGDIASDVLIENLKAEELPDGRLYWNIAERTILPLMQMVHEMVCQAATKQLEQEDEKIGIGIKPTSTVFPMERAKALMNAVVTRTLENGTDEE